MIVTVICNVSPDSTLRDDAKSTTPYRVPVVPDVALERNAPATVDVPLIEKSTLVALVIDPDEAAPSVHAGRVPEYADTSVHVPCEASVSAAAGVPAPFNPIYQVEICVLA